MQSRNRRIGVVTLPIGAAILLVGAWIANAGDLNPPSGAVAPTMKTLVEIEPRTAVNATNTPGDADSLFKITLPGSYYLTGPIDVPIGKHGIVVMADRATIDLNGFSIQGIPGSLNGIWGQGAKITVRKGEQSWTVEGDDQEALKKLPDDVRPFVERLLHRQGPGAGMFQGILGGNLDEVLPDQLGRFNFRFDGQQAEALERRAEQASQRMLERIEQLEKQLKQLEGHLNHEESRDGANAAADPTKT